jgi:hypothetical protein
VLSLVWMSQKCLCARVFLPSTSEEAVCVCELNPILSLIIITLTQHAESVSESCTGYILVCVCVCDVRLQCLLTVCPYSTCSSRMCQGCVRWHYPSCPYPASTALPPGSTSATNAAWQRVRLTHTQISPPSIAPQSHI